MSAFPNTSQRFNALNGPRRPTPGGQPNTSSTFVPNPNPFNGAAFGIGSSPSHFGNPNHGQALSAHRRGGRNTAMSQLARAFGLDVEATQGAADEQHDLLTGISDDFEGDIAQGETEILETGEETASFLDSLGEEFNEAGGFARDRFNQFSSEVQGNLDEDLAAYLESLDTAAGGARDRTDVLGQEIDEGIAVTEERALGFVEDAIGSAKSLVSDTKQLGAELMSSQIAGFEARTSTEANRIKAGLRPDGTQMSPGEKRAAMGSLRRDTNVAIAQTHAQTSAMAFNALNQAKTVLAQTQSMGAQVSAALGEQRLSGSQLKAGLEQFATGVELQAAAGKGEAAALKANVGVALSGQSIQVEQISQQFQQMRLAVGEISANIRNSSRAAATQLRMNGRIALADMVRQNPRSVVSLFNGITAMMAAASAPGAQNIGAFDFGVA